MHSSLTRFPIQGLCLNLLNSHGADLVGQQGGEGVQAHGAQVLAGAVAGGDGGVFHVPVAYYQHVATKYDMRHSAQGPPERRLSAGTPIVPPCQG